MNKTPMELPPSSLGLIIAACMVSSLAIGFIAIAVMNLPL